jgi:hypothetical protein
LDADKDRGYAFVLGDSLGSVNCRQEGKLTNGLCLLEGNGNGKAKEMARLAKFSTILAVMSTISTDQWYRLPRCDHRRPR